MLFPLLQFVASAVVIGVAAVYLTRYADAIAELTKFGRLLVGSVLLAGATSLPELAVDISAVRMGAADLAIGDLMGSSLFNLLILAVLDLSVFSRGRMLSRQGAAHALSGTFSASMAAIVAIGLLTSRHFPAYSLLNVSPSIAVIAIAYVAGVRLVYLDQRMAATGGGEHPPQEMPTPPGITLTQAAVGFAVCALVIVATGPFLAGSADQLAKLSGLGNTFVGTTLVALTTSLPELVSMIAALRMNAPDLVIGNVFGSNAFNMLLLLPLDLITSAPLLAMVSQRHAVTCVASILATQVVVLGQLYQVERRTRFLDPDAWLVVAIVLAALALIYYLPDGDAAEPKSAEFTGEVLTNTSREYGAGS
jgi:cation:H+ antiporter